MTKALREAKRHTTWTAPAEGYEAATSRFERGVFERSELLADMDRSFTPLIAAGAVASLAQLALKLTLPGVPDIYQGTELWDLRSEEHTSELQSLMRISYAVFCLKQKNRQ